MTTFATIIYGLLVLGLGIMAGAMWGLSQHRALLDWLQARTIRRWMTAMQSLGYEQWRIDQVLERMGQRIIPPYIPAPEPPVKPSPGKPSLRDKLTELHIAVAWHETVPSDDGYVVMQLCIDYAERLHAAACAGSLDLLEVDLQNEWVNRSKQDYRGRQPRVRIATDDYKENGVVEVLFDARSKEEV